MLVALTTIAKTDTAPASVGSDRTGWHRGVKRERSPRLCLGRAKWKETRKATQCVMYLQRPEQKQLSSTARGRGAGVKRDSWCAWGPLFGW